ncbi:MAG TPA: CHRD domain-containing protein [Longimicrobiales bacterium]|nr:CHRD domain-containing protein [Longimicrobiales bacterium]
MRSPGLLPALTLACLLATASAAHAQEGADTLAATLDGSAVVGGGDDNGSGTAVVWLDVDMTRVCYDLQVDGITEATAAHIHQAPAGQDGPPVITLSAPTGGASTGCANVDAALIDELRRDPSAFYVNVHNPDFPGGAIRGQLSGM